ncbi:MAG: NADH-quinone oxidoreductase subunit D [Elusimicrobia bacterium]|nr:MAG: NADH-quinone oxidoreductase subunit D [Elusimicrobiota bacterium]
MTAQQPESRAYMLNMGPAHPAMHGVIRLMLKLQGERVLEADAEIGYLHRAFEKHAEADPWNNVIPWTDRLNYVSPLINNAGYVMAVEKLAGIKVPERAEYLRAATSEVSRITDHLTCVGANAMELGSFTAFLYLLQAREELYRCIDKLTGARVTTSYTRVGGVKGDMPADWPDMVRAAFVKVRSAVKDADGLLTKNRIFVDRTRGTGVLSKETALAYGITGPVLRSTGVPYDVRRAEPYGIYDRLAFEVPVGEAGDNYDRYLVRLAEIEQSILIVEQCFQAMPSGPIQAPDDAMPGSKMADLGKHGKTADMLKTAVSVDPVMEGGGRGCHQEVLAAQADATLPPKEEAYGSIEGLMRHFEIIMWGRGITPPAGEAYQAVEGGNGELGFHVVSDGKDRAWRVRVRPPCFFNMAGLHTMLNGALLADVVATFGSINMIAGELDR